MPAGRVATRDARLQRGYRPRLRRPQGDVARPATRSPADRRFDLLILSDTTDPDVWLAEIEAWRRLRHEVGDEGRIFYRRRSSNISRKTGNIEDFVTRLGRRLRLHAGARRRQPDDRPDA